MNLTQKQQLSKGNENIRSTFSAEARASGVPPVPSPAPSSLVLYLIEEGARRDLAESRDLRDYG